MQSKDNTNRLLIQKGIIMKTFRLLATLLLIAVCAGFSSCGDDELDTKP